jgi:hypothetical protein
MLTPSGDLLVRPSFMERSALESFATSLQQHPLTAYARSLGALVRGQFERQKEHNGGRRACAELLRCRRAGRDGKAGHRGCDCGKQQPQASQG